jgi:hypothetical protein
LKLGDSSRSAELHSAVSQNFILQHVQIRNDPRELLPCRLQIGDTAQRGKAATSMEFRVYAAIAHNLGNVAKSRVNAELHAYASPNPKPFENPREMKQFPEILIECNSALRFRSFPATFDEPEF